MSKARNFGLALLGLSLGAGPFPQSFGQLEEVVVTAQKLEQTLAEVPISLSIFNADFLEDAGVNGFVDLAKHAPNFNFYEGYLASQVTFNMRGLTSGTENPGIDPAIGFFLDGVYLSRPPTILQRLSDVERIEVLRGPQGTLYGRNTSVGAVNIITKAPSDALQGTVQIGYGNYDALDTRARLSGPLGEGVAASLSLYYAGREQPLDNPALNGAPVGEEENWGGRLKVRFEPSEALSVTLIGDYSQMAIDSSMFSGLFARANFLDPRTEYRLDPFYEAERTPGVERNDVDDWGVSMNLDWSFERFSLRSITALRGTDLVGLGDADVVEANAAVAGGVNDNEQFSQELQLSSVLLDGRVSYLLGLYYFSSDFEHETPTTFPLVERLFGLPPQFTGHSIAIDTRSVALFGQLNHQLTDNLTATYGFRYNDEEKEVDVSQLPDPLLRAGSPPRFPIKFPAYEAQDSFSDQDWTSMVSLNYRFNDGGNLYFTYSQGLKSGGYNVQIVQDPRLQLQFDQERSANFEAGYRASPTPNLRFGLAAYYSEFEDLQIAAFSLVNPSVIVVQNAGDAEVKGLEADLTWAPVAGLSLNAALSYNDAQYTDTEILVDTRDAMPTDYSGRTLSRAPKWTGSASAQYSWPLNGQLRAVLRADYAFTDKQRLDALLDERSLIGSYGLLDLRAGIAGADGRWRVTLWSKNLTQEEYLTQALNSPAGAFNLLFPGIGIPNFLGSVGYPRTYGIEFAYNFGAF